MKKILYVLMITSLLLLSACGSSVSAEDYAAVVSENTSLKNENQSLSEKNSELLDQLGEQVVKKNVNATAIAWAQTHFGDNSVCLTEDNAKYIQCVAGNTYEISNEGISQLWHDLLQSSKTLAYVKDSIPYEAISIKFLDPSGEYILDVTLCPNDHEVLGAMMFNITYADIILSVFQNVN